jgi:type II secretory pathway component PulF
MPAFKVKAYDQNGDLKSFRREATTEDELLRALGFEGYVPISVQAEKSRDGGRTIKPLKLEDQHMFCSMLSAFLLSGLSLTEVLRLLQRQTRDKKLQPVFSELRESVESGRSLAQSMKTQGVFQEFLIGMVESGERSSSLPDILEKASALLQSQITLRRKITSALTYPILMLVVGFFVVAFLIAYVVPQLTGIVVDAGQTLPFATRLLLALSAAIKRGGLPALLIFLLASAYMKRKGKRIRLPLFREMRNLLTVSMLFSQLSTLIKTGVPLVQALEMSEPMDPEKGRIHFLAEDVRKGYRFSQSLERQGTFSEDIVAIVRIGEVGGNLPDCLDRIASNSWEFAQTSMQKWSSLAEPIIIMVLGVVVGFVVLAVLLPIFNLSDLASM